MVSADNHSSDATGEGTLENKFRKTVLISLWEENDGLRIEDIRWRGDDVDEIEKEMLEVHLPVLEEAGYIEVDEDSGTITKGPRFGEFERYIRREYDDETLLLEN